MYSTVALDSSMVFNFRAFLQEQLTAICDLNFTYASLSLFQVCSLVSSVLCNTRNTIAGGV